MCITTWPPNDTEEEALDVKFLGRELPGSPRLRIRLLNSLKEMLDEEGAEWVRSSRERLLIEAQMIAKEEII